MSRQPGGNLLRCIMGRFMDRRTWLQLMSVLAAARPAFTQERPAAAPPGAPPLPPPAPQPGRRAPQQGRGAQQPMRVTKEQVAAALKLLGLEFEDAEIEQMLRNVNRSLFTYE